MIREKARIQVKQNLAIKTEYVRISPLLKLALVLVRFNHIASVIVNANNSTM
jgi:hypothetical protein